MKHLSRISACSTSAFGIAYLSASLVYASDLEKIIEIIDRNSAAADSFRLDLATPSSPGFVVVGASPDNVARPGNLQELVIDTASFAEDGKLKPGLAINLQPFWFWNSNLTLEEYSGRQTENGAQKQHSLGPTERVFARTQLSFASVEGQSASVKSGMRYGLGLHTELLDGPDARYAADPKCVTDAWAMHAKPYDDAFVIRVASAITAARQANPGADIDELGGKIAEDEFKNLKTPEYDRAYADCMKRATDRISSATSWMLGAGVALSAPDSSFRSVRYSGASIWTTFKKPFGTRKAFSLFGKADIDHDFDIGGGVTVPANSFHGAASLSLEEPSEWKLESTISYHLHETSNSNFDDDYFQFTVGGSLKIRDGTWIEGTVGTRSGSKSRDESFTRVQLRLDLSGQANALVN